MKKTFAFMLGVLLLASCSVKKNEKLFNGKDLSGWYSYLSVPDSSVNSDLPRDSGGHYFKAIGLNADPLKVFSVAETDGAPAIRISGQVFGILVSSKEYENFHLKLEFKWGEKKYAPRADKKRDSGVLYYSIGPEGAWGGVWMKSKECQVQEGDVGDFIDVDTSEAVIPCTFDSLQNIFNYAGNGDAKLFNVFNSYCHKSADFEKPLGEWNTLEIYALGENTVHVVNGQVNMRTYHNKVSENGKLVGHTKGKIQLQSEGAEIYYRNITIGPIVEIPESIGKRLDLPGF